MIAPLAPGPDLEVVAPKLSTAERIRRKQLILTVEKGLTNFLAVGAALLELRSSRLYRETHDTFESFCRETFGLARSTTDQVIRSASTAQTLLDSGVTLSTGTTEAVLRPVSSLPAALQPVSWQLIEAASPKCGPTQPVVSKICRTIQNAISSPGDKTGHKLRNKAHPSRERPFVQAAQRLSAYKGFEPSLVVSHVEKVSSGLSIYTACEILATRCRDVQRVLVQRFPELCQPTPH